MSSSRKAKRAKLSTTSKSSSAPPVASDGAEGTSSAPIELLASFRKLRKSWPKDMPRMLDPSLDDERRGELWEIMCDGGDSLRQRFAWAIPDERALRIVKHFGPIIEIGSGLGYWAMLLRSRGVDIKAYDKIEGAPDPADKVQADKKGSRKANVSSSTTKKVAGKKGKAAAEQSGQEEEEDEDVAPSFWVKVEEGGPDVLEEPCNEKRALLLCYPDDFEGETESLGLRCLHSFEGDVVIHVGEVFGDSISMTPGQSPWGRTTSRDCQEELASKFHCILKVPLPSWPHSRDTLTVWKRHAFCAIHYDDSSSEEDEEDNEDNDVAGGGSASRRGQQDALLRTQPLSVKHPRLPGGEPGGSSEEEEGEEEEEGGGENDGGSSSGSFGGPLGSVDMYAFVPDDERLPHTQAAPCVKFLLDEKSKD